MEFSLVKCICESVKKSMKIFDTNWIRHLINCEKFNENSKFVENNFSK